MYVAVTRARRHLLLTYPSSGVPGSPQKPSRFCRTALSGTRSATNLASGRGWLFLIDGGALFWQRLAFHANHRCGLLLPERRHRRARLQVICAGREACRADYRVTRRTFPWLAIELVVRGEGRLRIGREMILLNVGTVFCYGPGVVYEMTTEADHPMVKYFAISPGRRRGGCWRRSRCGRGTCGTRFIRWSCRRFSITCWRRKPALAPFGDIALQYLRLFLQKLPECAEYSPHRAASQTLEFYLKAKAFLEKNHETLATSEAAAGSLGVTPETLCRVFQRFASTTPYQYLLRLKITAQSICCSARACRRRRWGIGWALAIRFIFRVCSSGSRAVRRRISGCFAVEIINNEIQESSCDAQEWPFWRCGLSVNLKWS